MKMWTVAAALLFLGTFGFAQTAQTTPATPTALPHKSCDDLKAEISKKLDAKGVVGYTLEAVDKGKEGDAKVIGSCDGGTKSITYTRGAAASTPAPAKTDEKKPQ
jgi:hypothetical protein